jgi:type II secretory pathway pseudopilin PulG
VKLVPQQQQQQPQQQQQQREQQQQQQQQYQQHARQWQPNYLDGNWPIAKLGNGTTSWSFKAINS